MTHEEHRKRHIELHAALDELVADFLRHNLKWTDDIEKQKLPSRTTIAELMTWSQQQTIKPDVQHG